MKHCDFFFFCEVVWENQRSIFWHTALKTREQLGFAFECRLLNSVIVLLYKVPTGGAAGSVATSQLQGPWSHPVLGFLSITTWMCSWDPNSVPNMILPKISHLMKKNK